MMILGGNSTLQKYFEENKIDVDSFPALDQKFKLKECEKYREKVGLFVILFIWDGKKNICIYIKAEGKGGTDSHKK